MLCVQNVCLQTNLLFYTRSLVCQCCIAIVSDLFTFCGEAYSAGARNSIDHRTCKGAVNTADGFYCAAKLLPFELREAALKLPESERGAAEEFRLRTGRSFTVLLPDGEHEPAPGRRVLPSDVSQVLEAASRASVHSVAGELRRGFVTAPGGVRVGVCGTASQDGGVRDVSSMNIRIPREMPGIGAAAARRLLAPVRSVLIISPPGGGKTTFLRELVRLASSSGVRVSLADERGEIAAAHGGVPQFDVGPCTDVLTGAERAQGALTLLRSMSPQVIAMDEISEPEDAAAVLSIANCAVKIFATAHADCMDDLSRREIYRSLMSAGVFDAVAVIKNRHGAREYEVTQL